MTGLEGKVCVVTGGGSGIGKATCLLLASSGAKVVVAGRNIQNLKDVADEVGDSARVAVCDVTSEAEVAGAIRIAIESFGGLDVMINNAGLSWMVPINEMPSEVMSRSLQVNLMSVFFGIRHSIGPMRARGGGAIITTASVTGHLHTASPGLAHYGAAKAAAIHLTLSAAIELRQFNIRVNAICPGNIETPLFASVADPVEAAGVNLRELIAQKQGRMGTPEECAHAIAFLASDRSRFISGAVLPVDNALSAQINM